MSSADDPERPLTRLGWMQAAALATRLPSGPDVRVLSSPLLRCRQTVEPYAVHLGIEVETDERLQEGADPSVLADWLWTVTEAASGPVVMCSHGDVIPETMRLLHRRGVDLDRSAGACSKASAWQVALTGPTSGTGTYRPSDL